MDPKLRRRIITITVTVIVLVAVCLIFLWVWLHGRLVLQLPNEANNVTVMDVSGREVVNTSVQKEEFSAILASGNYEVVVSSEDNKKVTTYFLDIPNFLQVNERDVTLHNQASRHKIGLGSQACPVLSDNTLFSYNCAGSDNIEKTPTLSLDNSLSPEEILLPNIISLQSYRDGMLALHTETYLDEQTVQPQLSFIKNGEIIEQRELPNNLYTTPDDRQDYKLQINEAQPEKFIITLDNNRTAFVFNNFADEGTQLEFDNLADEANQTVGPLHYINNTILYAVGEARQDATENQPQSNTVTADGVIVDTTVQVRKYQIDENAATLDSSTSINNVSSDRMSICTSELICLFDATAATISIFTIEESPRQVATIHNTSGNVTPLKNENFVYMSDNRVSLFNSDTLEARQIYYSDNFELSSLTSSPKGLILNTLPLSDGETTDTHKYSFLLTSTEPAETNTFVDDTLPYPSGAIGGAVLKSDYYDNTILIRVQLSSWQSPVRVSGGGASEYTYDEAEFNDKRQRILEQLEQDGFTEPEYDIRIEP